ncbi:hypothetical protein [Streptomyces sp. NPDC026589]|uniref:hypothetical protein n=1 Tax=Streptomyces TaxID=1883 RepID=UPI0033C7C912|nr:hypothetical protein OHB50_30715 [Streptomyces anulatus]
MLRAASDLRHSHNPPLPGLRSKTTAKENDLTSRPQHLRVEVDIHQQVTLLARALGITPSETIAHLLRLYAQPSPETPARPDMFTPVYAIYQRRRIEGHFDRSTGALSIPAGPGAGQYKTPSGAARAVITALRPGISPIRTGWAFWRLAESGAHLEVLRSTTAYTRTTTSPPAPMPASTAAATPRTR